MSVRLVDCETQYNRDKNLKKTDVEALIQWVSKQPHLPKISEFQAILFLQSCYYSNEAAKKTIDAFFTVKTLARDLFGGRNPSETSLQTAINAGLITPLPKKTPEGYKIIFVKLMDTKPENYNFSAQLKYLDMSLMLHLFEEGISEGHIFVFDMKGTVFGHMTRVGMAAPSVLRKFSFYLQEAVPLRLKGIHFFNIVSFMDKVLALVRPLMNMELLNMLYIHNSVEDLVKVIPRECLPEDYGGSAKSTSFLHERNKNRLVENSSFFAKEDQETIDESKRPQRSSDINNIFGIEGTFKKLEID